jgi:hypothetical protein
VVVIVDEPVAVALADGVVDADAVSDAVGLPEPLADGEGEAEAELDRDDDALLEPVGVVWPVRVPDTLAELLVEADEDGVGDEDAVKLMVGAGVELPEADPEGVAEPLSEGLSEPDAVVLAEGEGVEVGDPTELQVTTAVDVAEVCAAGCARAQSPRGWTTPRRTLSR